jgi:hypothetical protein
MSLAGQLDFGRSDRVALDRAGTLRDHAQAPLDVRVDNLSTSGCLLTLDRTLPVGALVSIGIAGVGVRQARVSRVDAPHHACAFLQPVSAADVATALSAETLVAGAFPAAPSIVPVRAVLVETETLPAPRDGEYRLPLVARVAVIGGASAALWVTIVGMAGTLLR